VEGTRSARLSTTERTLSILKLKIKKANPDKVVVGRPDVASHAITIAASAEAGADLSRRDLVETFGSSGFTVSPSVAAQSYQATGQSAASSEETS
jgi:hypothetical protein